MSVHCYRFFPIGITLYRFLDVQLPGMTGPQLQSHLASAGYHIPIIFITGSADDRAQALALEMGAVNLLTKPSGHKALLKEIRLVLKSA